MDWCEEIDIHEANRLTNNFMTTGWLLSKDKLLEMLSQPGCEGIAVYETIGMDEKQIVTIGVNVSQMRLEDGLILERSKHPED